jgi:hypothetical protein
VRGSGFDEALFPALIQPSHGPTLAASTLRGRSLGPRLGRRTRSNSLTPGGPNSWRHPAISIDDLAFGLINNAGGHFLLLVRCSQGTIFGIDDEDSQ